MTVGLHWVRGVSFLDVDRVLDHCASTLSESVVVLDHGTKGYPEGYLVGPVRVSVHPGRPDMGVCVDVSGEACEELGHARIADLCEGVDLRYSRLDVALDHCPFTPVRLRDEWRADRVRTRCKVPMDARPDRQWRTSDWREHATGDTFYMGARSSTQYARVYDRRGFTRFELEIKGDLAASIGEELVRATRDAPAFRSLALSMVRRFVDFVDPSTSSNRSRCTLLPFWEKFVAGVARASVSLPGRLARTVAEIDAWIAHQVAPALAVVHAAFGADRLAEFVDQGRRRWTRRHRDAVRAAVPAMLPGTA